MSGISNSNSNTATQPKGPVVLLVDDQAIVGQAIKRMLADEPDIQFHFCQNPFESIEMATNLKPTVILQDLVMPEVDGLTLVKFFRSHSATRETPLIVLSSTEDPKTKAEAFGLGANDYLVAPSQLTSGSYYMGMGDVSSGLFFYGEMGNWG